MCKHKAKHMFNIFQHGTAALVREVVARMCNELASIDDRFRQVTVLSSSIPKVRARKLTLSSISRSRTNAPQSMRV